jgi:hypothetical protein
MFTLSRRLQSAADLLDVSFVVDLTRASATERTYTTTITLSSATQFRTYYFLGSGRTNTTTGNKLWATCSIIAGASTYTGTRIAGDSTAGNNPVCVFSISVPASTGNATLQITFTGGDSGYGLVGWAGCLYEARGNTSVVQATSVVGSSLNFSTVNNGVLLAGAADTTSTPGTPAAWDALDQSATPTGWIAKHGRKTVTKKETTTVSSTNATRVYGVSLGTHSFVSGV